MSLTYGVECPDCDGTGQGYDGRLCDSCDSTGNARCEARNRWTGFRQIRCPQDAAVMASRPKGDAFPACLDCVYEQGLSVREASDVAA